MTAPQRLARLARLAGYVPTGPSTAARTPFVLLIVALLGTGMLVLLLLNAALNQGSFEQSELRRQTQELVDEQQALQAEVDAYSAPAALAGRAAGLGLVPGGPPVFLNPDGTIVGSPQTAPEPEPEAEAEPEPEAEAESESGPEAEPEPETGAASESAPEPEDAEERPEQSPPPSGTSEEAAQ